MRLYHTTTSVAAEAILKEGFRDSTGFYMISRETTGVWLANVPLDVNEGTKGNVLLLVDMKLPESEIREFEWVEECKPYREWQIPAKLINEFSTVKLADD